MAEEDDLKNYIKKIQNITSHPEFSLFDRVFVKKSRIDDLYCCMMAVLPEKFEYALKIINELDIRDFPSVVAFSVLTKKIRTKTFVSKDLYSFNSKEINDVIKQILTYLTRDTKKLLELQER